MKQNVACSRDPNGGWLFIHRSVQAKNARPQRLNSWRGKVRSSRRAGHEPASNGSARNMSGGESTPGFGQAQRPTASNCVLAAAWSTTFRVRRRCGSRSSAHDATRVVPPGPKLSRARCCQVIGANRRPQRAAAAFRRVPGRCRRSWLQSGVRPGRSTPEGSLKPDQQIRVCIGQLDEYGFCGGSDRRRYHKDCAPMAAPIFWLNCLRHI